MDIIAFIWFLVCWLGYSYYSDRAQRNDSNVVTVLHQYRLRWMSRMLKRENRVGDVNIVDTLIRSVSLFASTNIFILAGLVTVLGGVDVARELVSEISFAVEAPRELWEAKVLILILIFVHAFFTLVWALRQLSFALVLIGGAPLPEETDAADREGFAERAALLITRGVNTFNRGLRAYYFGMAMLSWFIQPLLLVAVSIWVVLVLYRREFRSVTLQTLTSPDRKLISKP